MRWLNNFFRRIGEWLQEAVTLPTFTVGCKQIVVSDLRGSYEHIYTLPVKNIWLFKVAMFLQQGSDLKQYRVRAFVWNIVTFKKNWRYNLKFLLKNMFSPYRVGLEKRDKNNPNQITSYNPWSII